VEYEELIERLRALGCDVQRISVDRKTDGRTIEVFVARRGGVERTFQVGPGDLPMPFSVLDSLVRRLGFSMAEFARVDIG
jgi:hypothetical protein